MRTSSPRREPPAIEATVSDPLSTSRTARESLARGLQSLQADPTIPSHLVDLAAPIAQAMGALHQIERTNQLAPHADVALNHVRGALAQLQSAPGGHPAVAIALESVANSLSLVHALSRMAATPRSVETAPAPAVRAPDPVQPHPAAVIPAPNAAGAMPGRTAALPTAGATAPLGQAGTKPHASPLVARDPFAAPSPRATGQPSPNAGGLKPTSPSMPVPAPPAAGNVPVVAADLGAHSPTNFYKGLSGNDIIDHGGLFVSTYVSPKIGAPVRLRVSLPGGYEFEANAVVKWTRDQGGDAPPGFGAQFIAITAEARQLVYRYVRNREPLFHDDF